MTTRKMTTRRMVEDPILSNANRTSRVLPKAVAFSILGVGADQIVAFVLFEDGSVRQVRPEMIPAEKPNV